jgi:hypothetical protein
MAALEILNLKIFWKINVDQTVRIQNNSLDCTGPSTKDTRISYLLCENILPDKENVDRPRKM